MNPSPFKNYRDISVRVGTGACIQLEFYCGCCDFTWKSQPAALKSTRTLGLFDKLQLLAGLLGQTDLRSTISKAGSATRFAAGSAEEAAFKKAVPVAQAQAARYFNACVTCGDICCENCIVDANGQCKRCVQQARGAATQPRGGYGGDAYGGESQQASGGAVCSNCQTPSQGGRFCHECGFDMASTHKSCPTCGSVLPRAARFCTDCGHGF